MDETDRKILAELQRNGRISVSELAQKIGLSDSPCHRRLKALEKAGVITGYRAEINAAAVGLGFSALVFVTLKECTAQLVEGFEEAVQRVPQITSCRRSNPLTSRAQDFTIDTPCGYSSTANP